MRRVIVLLGSLFLLWSGCAEEVELSMDDFLLQYPKAYCSYIISCCDQAERSYGSENACTTVVEEQLSELLAFRESATPFATLVADQAADCLERLKAKQCTEDANLAFGCLASITRSSHQAGDECTYAVECSSYYCIQPQQNTKGYCGNVGSGQCSGDDRACSEGSYCSSARQCTPKVENSGTCGRGNECQSGICSPSAKICVPKQTPFCDGK